MTPEQIAALITALNGTLAANKTIGTHRELERICKNKIEELIKAIKL